MKPFETTVADSDLDTFAAEILATLSPSKEAAVIALTGDLGAGKTAFVKAVAARLGVAESVTSPTFTIMKQYETINDRWSSLVHMDAYRIESIDELAPLRFRQLLESPNTLFCIEWADQIEDVLPSEARWLHFTTTDDELVRSVQIR